MTLGGGLVEDVTVVVATVTVLEGSDNWPGSSYWKDSDHLGWGVSRPFQYPDLSNDGKRTTS